METLFWLSLAALIYTYLGYPALVGLGARLSPRRIPPAGAVPDLKVSAVLVVYNEEKLIRSRLENLLGQDHPLLEIIVVCDGSTDATAEVVSSLAQEKIKLIVGADRVGKPACLRLGVEQAQGDLILFCDARQRFAPNTVSRLVQWFAADSVGAVSGALEIERSQCSVGQGVGSYWNFEKWLRYAESQLDSCVGCTGAVYAIRKSLFKDFPPDTLLDDVIIPMQIAIAGHRVLFNPEAIAYDPQALDPDRERIRKKRTLAGNFQMLFRYPGWMTPWGNRLWWQLLSHKYLRVLAPAFLVGALASSGFLLDHPFYRLALGGQAVLYLAGILGAISPLKKSRLFSLPASFLFLNLMVLRGFNYYLSGTRAAWERVGEPGSRAASREALGR